MLRLKWKKLINSENLEVHKKIQLTPSQSKVQCVIWFKLAIKSSRKFNAVKDRHETLLQHKEADFNRTEIKPCCKISKCALRTIVTHQSKEQTTYRGRCLQKIIVSRGGGTN